MMVDGGGGWWTIVGLMLDVGWSSLGDRWHEKGENGAKHECRPYALSVLACALSLPSVSVSTAELFFVCATFIGSQVDTDRKFHFSSVLFTNMIPRAGGNAGVQVAVGGWHLPVTVTTIQIWNPFILVTKNFTRCQKHQH